MLKIRVSFTAESRDAAYRELDRMIRTYAGCRYKPPKLDPKTDIWRGYIEVKTPPKNAAKH